MLAEPASQLRSQVLNTYLTKLNNHSIETKSLYPPSNPVYCTYQSGVQPPLHLSVGCVHQILPEPGHYSHTTGSLNVLLVKVCFKKIIKKLYLL